MIELYFDSYIKDVFSVTLFNIFEILWSSWEIYLFSYLALCFLEGNSILALMAFILHNVLGVRHGLYTIVFDVDFVHPNSLTSLTNLVNFGHLCSGTVIVTIS